MTYRTLELKEEVLRYLSQAELTTSEIIALQATGKFGIEPASFLNGNQYGIRSRGWVGHVLAGDDLLINQLDHLMWPILPNTLLIRLRHLMELK